MPPTNAVSGSRPASISQLFWCWQEPRSARSQRARKRAPRARSISRSASVPAKVGP
jgi:hypothetical protein